MISETMRVEDSQASSAKVLYEFRGQLTQRETLNLGLWLLARSALRFYARAVLFFAIFLAVTLVVQQQRGLFMSSQRFIGPLILLHVYVLGYLLFRLIKMLRAVRRHERVDGRDSIVRFYDSKVEMVSFEGIVRQIPARLIRLQKTRFGIVAVTLKGLPFFLLPLRVLTPQEFTAIPQLYTVGQQT